MTPLDLPYGVHANIPEERYHERRLGVVSKGALDLVHRSPAHYRAWIDGQLEKASPALAFGRAFHCAMLEPEKFAQAYAVEPDFGDCRTKANKAARDDWRQCHSAAELLSPDDHATIAGMVASVRAHPLAGRM